VDARLVIERLGLEPHPEGGWYRQTWRHEPAEGSGGAGTAIYYLLAAGERSAWHRVDATEIWHSSTTGHEEGRETGRMVTPDEWAVENEDFGRAFKAVRAAGSTREAFENIAAIKLLADTPAGAARQQVYEDFMHRETRDETEVMRALEVAQQVEAAEAKAGGYQREPTRAEVERAEHERQRQAIVDAGATPVMSTTAAAATRSPTARSTPSPTTPSGYGSWRSTRASPNPRRSAWPASSRPRSLTSPSRWLSSDVAHHRPARAAGRGRSPPARRSVRWAPAPTGTTTTTPATRCSCAALRPR
jgi:Cupin superfamily (DUF985)